MDSRPWGGRTLTLLESSLPLLGITLFLYAYAHVRFVYSGVPFTRVVVYGLFVLLFCRWARDALRLWSEKDASHTARPLISRLRVLIMGTRAFAIAYIVVAWMIGEGSVLFLGRVLFEVVFFVWSVSFWKTFRLIFSDGPSSDPPMVGLRDIRTCRTGLYHCRRGTVGGIGRLRQTCTSLVYGLVSKCCRAVVGEPFVFFSPRIGWQTDKSSDVEDSGPLEKAVRVNGSC